MGDAISEGEQNKISKDWVVYRFFTWLCFYKVSNCCCGIADKEICDLTIEKKKKSLIPDEDNLPFCNTSEFIRNNERNRKITSSSKTSDSVKISAVNQNSVKGNKRPLWAKI